jgi:hypothetical protein
MCVVVADALHQVVVVVFVHMAWGHGCGCATVTAKMATPTKVDSELTDVQLESCRRATEALEGIERGR